MPKRRSSEGDGGSTAERRRPQQLYLIFDNWSRGYSIREVNLPSGSSHLPAVSGKVAEQRLPPPIFRLAVPRQLPQYFVCAFGTKIIAAHPKDPVFEPTGENSIPILGVRKRSIIIGPAQSLFPVYPTYVPVGDRRLFCLHSGFIELLCRSQREQPSGDNMEWAWCNHKALPFESNDVSSYAVHPAGPSILVSTKSTRYGTTATFSFHTEEFVWKQLGGEWMLPFTGRAHYVRYLEIFVGLSKDPETLGHLTSNTQCPAPAWKLCQEKLFSDNPGEEHVSATHVYMGSKSKFCLVECILFEDVRADQVLEERGLRQRGSCYMYRLMKFSLRFDMNGDLKTKSQRVGYFKVPEKTSIELIFGGPVAFVL
ncbi:hypothetical protein PAHAL_1G446300 [Panicum hallii]|jgi:hypothetical protein|uniref:DUF1618 domain-containing protein n=1 Tax=Panicum hallii TaxID=206008 RepID=A0A2S3GUZ3_9POAL|nr:hypothetical protein PAHAL_1G446300 [Panicum hallii]